MDAGNCRWCRSRLSCCLGGVSLCPVSSADTLITRGGIQNFRDVPVICATACNADHHCLTPGILSDSSHNRSASRSPLTAIPGKQVSANRKTNSRYSHLRREPMPESKEGHCCPSGCCNLEIEIQKRCNFLIGR